MKEQLDIKNDLRRIRNTKDLIDYIEKNIKAMTDYDWYFVTNSDHFNLRLASEYAEYVDWSSICTYRRDLPETFMRKNAGYLDWYSVSCFQKLGKSFMRDFEDKLSLDKLVGNEYFIENAELGTFASSLYDKRKDNQKYKSVWNKNLENSIFKPSRKITLTNNFSETKKYTEEEVDNLSKNEMKAILTSRGIRAYYHDTVQQLKKKILEN
jgi:hypothetical protein